MKQEVVKPESDWIRIEKNHEPIISDRDFEIVQRLLGMDTRISPDSDMVYNLSGIADYLQTELVKYVQTVVHQ